MRVCCLSVETRMELARYYLYTWGFVCTSFYGHSSAHESLAQPKSQDLLLAIVWLLAFSRFFDRLRGLILEVSIRILDSVSVLRDCVDDVSLTIDGLLVMTFRYI